MFLIESTNAKNWRWISGLVATRAEAELQLAATSESQRHFHKIVEISAAALPIFMIEAQGFEFGDIEFIRQRLRLVEPAGDEDVVHFNVYAFKSHFLPEVPGRDEMGRILHWHITDATLRSPRAEVLDSEMSDIANDA